MPANKGGKARAVSSIQPQPQPQTTKPIKKSVKAKVRSIDEHINADSINSNQLIKPIHLTQNLMSVFNGLEISDTGNAEAFIHVYREKYLFCQTRLRWLEWTGSTWEVLPSIDKSGIHSPKVMEDITRITRGRMLAAKYHSSETKGAVIQRKMVEAENAARIRAILFEIASKPIMCTTIDEFDCDPMLCGTQNGVLDLRTGEHRAARPEDKISMRFGTIYDKDAKCKRWDSFQGEVFNSVADLMGYNRRAFGYSATGRTFEQKIFFCFGDGRNGKSKMLRIIERIFGDYAGTAGFRTLDYERRSQIGDDLAGLKGKRFVSIIETPDDRRLDEARVKSLTGEDTIKCRFLYANEFSYHPAYKIWIAMNHRPRIVGTDRGIWGRIQEIPFLVNFEGREDKLLEAKLLDELPGILNWIIQGALEWQEKGLGSCQAVERATEEYRIESDHLGKWLSECVIEDELSIMVSNNAYDSYRAWAKERGEHAFTQTAWGRMLSRMHYESLRQVIGNRKATVYKGLRIRESGDK